MEIRNDGHTRSQETRRRVSLVFPSLSRASVLRAAHAIVLRA